MKQDKNISRRSLIADIELIQELKNLWTRIDEDTLNWSEIYYDKTSQKQWLYYFIDSELHGGGYPVLAKKPLLNTLQLIKLAIDSIYDDEIFAACRILVNEEKGNELNFRKEMIDAIENIEDRERQLKIIKYTALDSPLNRQEIVGKKYEEIFKNASYYKDISERANKLKQ